MPMWPTHAHVQKNKREIVAKTLHLAHANDVNVFASNASGSLDSSRMCRGFRQNGTMTQTAQDIRSVCATNNPRHLGLMCR
jgi:hypothetical protein